ncbi:MAG TPA: tryptophan synthase subunit alpha [Gemmatimonadales bacterium]|nr:tryptophan synthase subunit alpha [Gemmatimonadales bacterium]
MTTSSESSLARRLAERRAAGRPALVPYVTAGHPSPAATRELLGALGGMVDAVEVGIPFSDPLADGPVIQRASQEALAAGMTPAGVLELVAAARPPVPVVLFSYVNPVLQYGPAAFLRDAAAAGVSGLLLTDLPAGADPELEAAVRASALDLVPLVAPTTTPARLRRIVAGAQGFVYLVARLGVTGASAELDAGLEASVSAVRAATSLPVLVGFGVSTPAQAARVATLADGVVVGSALVDRLGRGGVAAGLAFLTALRSALDEVRSPVHA